MLLMGGGMVVWLALSPHSEKVRGLNPGSALAYPC